MGQSFGNQFILVDVTTDASVRGIALRQRWIAAAKPEQAVTLVQSAIPEVARQPYRRTSNVRPEETLDLKPGEVRRLT